MPGLENDVLEDINMVVALTNKSLRGILCYYVNHTISGLFQINKELILDAIRKHMEGGSTNHSSNQKEHNQIVVDSAEENQI